MFIDRCETTRPEIDGVRGGAEIEADVIGGSETSSSTLTVATASRLVKRLCHLFNVSKEFAQKQINGSTLVEFPVSRLSVSLKLYEVGHRSSLHN